MSFSPGDRVFLCGPNGPIEAAFVRQSGPDCVINADGSILIVLCQLLHNSSDACPIDQGSLSVGERVALQVNDGDGIVRTWPSDVQKIHGNGRVQVKMSGLSSPQTVDRALLLRLGSTDSDQ